MIFISYAREDFEDSLKLYERLSEKGHNPWLDKKNILPGSDWEYSIESAIRKCEYFVALLSQNSIEKRGYVQKEIKKGLDIYQTIPFNKVFLIPARIEYCEPQHPTLQKLQWVDFFPDWDLGFSKLDRVFSFIPNNKANPNLASTHWIAHDSDGEQWEFYLKGNGVVEIKHHNITQENGKWRQASNKLYMEFNDK